MAVERVSQSPPSSPSGLQSQHLYTEEKKTAVQETTEIHDVERDTDEEPAVVDARSDIPDGGFMAWLQVAGAFGLYFNSWGFVNTFGVYQTYYELNLLKDSTPDAISWIGSVQAFIMLGSSLISGPLFDAGYFRTEVAVGGFLVCFGTMMTSLVTKYWQALLAQSVCIGVGGGFICVPALSLLTQWFSKKQALATGITVIGSSIGGVVYPLAFQGLVETVGFGWANRVLGFISLTMSAFAFCVMKQRVTPRKVRSLFDTSAFREAPYNLFCMGLFVMNMAFMIPIVYLQIYAMNNGLGGAKVALHLVAILNASSIAGRLSAAFIVPHIGPINTMILVVSLVSLVIYTWIAVHTAAGNIIFAVAYGFTSGGIVSLPAVVMTSITKDLRFVGARLGTAFLVTAAASLSGTPIAGAILRTSGGYLGVQLFAAVTMTLSVVFMMAIRWWQPGPIIGKA